MHLEDKMNRHEVRTAAAATEAVVILERQIVAAGEREARKRGLYRELEEALDARTRAVGSNNTAA